MMFDLAALSKCNSKLWSNSLVILGLAAGSIAAVFLMSSFESMKNKHIAKNIYLLNQQMSVVNHIGVLAKYFDASNNKVEFNSALEYQAISTSISNINVQSRLNTTLSRNELRDLAKQLEKISNSFSDNRIRIPASIQSTYFDGEQSALAQIRHLVAAANKLSQLSSEDNEQITQHIELISKYRISIDSAFNKISTRYYSYFVERASQQGQSYWHYLVLIFVCFCGSIFIFVLKPFQIEIKNAYQHAIMANRIKTEFLTSVSHEIRTPMHGIISAGENLSDTRLDNKQKNYIRTIMSSADSLLDVVNDILGFSALESGETSVELIRFNFFDLTNDLIQIMEERAKLKGLELIVRYENGVPHEICADSSLIRQVLYHLLSNAIKFTESGSIVITVDKVAPESGGDMVLRISVEDTGIGIEESKLDIIFEQFVQANGGTKRIFSGTGLGLSICKKMVELMGGNIRVSSVLGEGATFTFIVPLNYSDRLQRTELPVAPNTMGSILFIGDDLDFSRQILPKLAKGGLQVICKPSNGFLGYDDNPSEKISLIVIDYFIKFSSPSRLLQQAKANGLFANARFICVSRNYDKFTARNLTDQGFDGIFSLPNDSDIFNDFIMSQTAAIRSSNNLAITTAKNTHSSDLNNLNGASILLVEDNRINAALAEDMLVDFGAKVVVAENGQIAFEKVRAGEPFDLVLMDCMMPIMDGFEATRLIRDLPQAKASTLPIIALTANAMVGDKELCFEAGMNAYLAKPVRKRDLQKTITKWLQLRNRSNSLVSAGAVKKQTLQEDEYTHPISASENLAVSDELEPSSAKLSKKGKSQLYADSLVRNPEQHRNLKRTIDNSQPIDTHIDTDENIDAIKPLLIPSVGFDSGLQIESPVELKMPLGGNNEFKLQYLDVTAVLKAKAMMKRRFRTMIEYFLEDTQSYIDQIREGIDVQDYSQLVVSSHTIKSSSRQMGAFAVSDLSKEIEFLAREEIVDFETLLDLTQRLQDQFDLSRIDFNYLLSEAG